ncbi:MAG: hypothetical protein H7098_07810 [Oligoflexus sp.]|nr:hypothetical protein [Pseudopedobacter sp.]
MEKLELKEIVGYLPYKLQMTRNGFVGELLCVYTDKVFKVSCSNWHESLEDDNFYKPILRPLSDLTKEIEVNGERKIISDYTLDKMSFNLGINYLNTLFKYHFDVYGLINRGLAIDINTLDNENQTHTS